MGACRMGFDLCTAAGRKNFLQAWHGRKAGWKVDWRMIIGDTVGPLLCKLWRGHKLYNANDGGWPPEMACRRCHKFIN